MFKNIVFFLSFFLVASVTSGQRYNYIHYTTENGLPTNILYNAVQDSSGAILINSENGLIRYNGLDFKLFSTRDGLSSNDIINSEVDRYGRVWLHLFGEKVCYYKDGVIYTSSNDSLVKRISSLLHSNNNAITIDNNGDVVIYDFKLNDSLGRRAVSIKGDSIKIVASFKNELLIHPLIRNNDLTYSLNNDRVLILKDKKTVDSFSVALGFAFYAKIIKGICYSLVINAEESGLVKFRLDQSFSDFKVLKSSYSRDYASSVTFFKEKVYYARKNRIFITDMDLGSEKIFDEFPSHIQINGLIADKQGNLWISTRNDGLYFLSATALVSNTYLSNRIVDRVKIHKPTGTIYYASGEKIYRIKSTSNEEEVVLEKKYGYSKTVFDFSFNKLISVFESRHLAVQDIKQYRNIQRLRKPYFLGPVKDIKCFGDNIAIAATFGVAIIDKSGKSLVEHKKRTTCLAYNKFSNSLLAGTMDGVMRFSLKNMGAMGSRAFPEMEQTVRAIEVGSDQIVWVLGNDKIFAFRNDTLIHTLSELKGLSNYSLNCINGSDPNCLLIGTSKGIVFYKYKINGKQLQVMSEDIVDAGSGLLDDFVKDVKPYNGSEWLVATNTGLSILNLSKLPIWKDIKTEIFELKVNGDLRAIEDEIKLTHKEQFIRLRFSSLFYGRMKKQYKYRLVGLREKWAKTTGNEIEFGPLEPGNYKFEVVAVDKDFNNIGPVSSLPIFIEPAFWQTILFKVVLGLIIFFILASLLYLWLQRKKNTLENERTFAELKMSALKAQMNPHFIFNSLNAIQSYINEGDTNESNRYISKFAKLIRQTLNFAAQDYISLKDEIQYLENYVALEKLRFGNRFDYELIVDESINQEIEKIPPMLIQIYAENAIRHGLNHKEETGSLILKFEKALDILICTISDNGIGRKESALRKVNSSSPLSESKGMSLNLDRLEMYNVILDNNITIDIVDEEDNSGYSIGTTVILKIPAI